jgi:hypothetical protein
MRTIQRAGFISADSLISGSWAAELILGSPKLLGGTRLVRLALGFLIPQKLALMGPARAKRLPLSI